MLDASGNDAAGQGWLAEACERWSRNRRTSRARLPADAPDVPARLQRPVRGRLRPRDEGQPRPAAGTTSPTSSPSAWSAKAGCRSTPGGCPDGLALLDEAMAGVAAGEVSPIMAGRIYCIDDRRLPGARRRPPHDGLDPAALDLVRAAAGPGPVHRRRRPAHRAQIMRAQGAWSDALDELALAEERYEAQGLGTPPSARSTTSGARCSGCRVISTRQQPAYAAADEHGHDPQPGLSLLWLAQGRVDCSPRRPCGGCSKRSPNPVHRSRVLPVAVEVLVAAGDVDGAAAVADELEQIATTFASAALSAAAAYARGSSAWRRTIRPLHFRTCARPGGAGSTSAHATRRLGRAPGSARRSGPWATRTRPAPSSSWPAGRSTSSAPTPARGEVERLLGGGRPDGLTARELEVLRLVAAGRTNPQIAARSCSSARRRSPVTSATSSARRT